MRRRFLLIVASMIVSGDLSAATNFSERVFVCTCRPPSGNYQPSCGDPEIKELRLKKGGLIMNRKCKGTKREALQSKVVFEIGEPCTSDEDDDEVLTTVRVVVPLEAFDSAEKILVQREESSGGGVDRIDYECNLVKKEIQ
jgi:hypothetical protein